MKFLPRTLLSIFLAFSMVILPMPEANAYGMSMGHGYGMSPMYGGAGGHGCGRVRYAKKAYDRRDDLDELRRKRRHLTRLLRKKRKYLDEARRRFESYDRAIDEQIAEPYNQDVKAYLRGVFTCGYDDSYHDHYEQHQETYHEQNYRQRRGPLKRIRQRTYRGGGEAERYGSGGYNNNSGGGYDSGGGNYIESGMDYTSNVDYQGTRSLASEANDFDEKVVEVDDVVVTVKKKKKETGKKAEKKEEPKKEETKTVTKEPASEKKAVAETEAATPTPTEPAPVTSSQAPPPVNEPPPVTSNHQDIQEDICSARGGIRRVCSAPNISRSNSRSGVARCQKARMHYKESWIKFHRLRKEVESLESRLEDVGDEIGYAKSDYGDDDYGDGEYGGYSHRRRGRPVVVRQQSSGLQSLLSVGLGAASIYAGYKISKQAIDRSARLGWPTHQSFGYPFAMAGAYGAISGALGGGGFGCSSSMFSMLPLMAMMMSRSQHGRYGYGHPPGMMPYGGGFGGYGYGGRGIMIGGIGGGMYRPGAFPFGQAGPWGIGGMPMGGSMGMPGGYPGMRPGGYPGMPGGMPMGMPGMPSMGLLGQPGLGAPGLGVPGIGGGGIGGYGRPSLGIGSPMGGGYGMVSPSPMMRPYSLGLEQNYLYGGMQRSYGGYGLNNLGGAYGLNSGFGLPGNYGGYMPQSYPTLSPGFTPTPVNLSPFGY